uniref:Kelch domain containing 10 n=1 Tax=Anas platyrhynchos TaxID=8839 RepID=A0A8B9TIR0_ANAPL
MKKKKKKEAAGNRGGQRGGSSSTASCSSRAGRSRRVTDLPLQGAAIGAWPDNANLYVFGGYNPDYDESGGPENEDYPLFRELWRYNFATDTWHQMGTEGYMPRELASMSLVLHGNNLLVFGGTGIPFGESNGNDVHVCNVKYKRWALLSCRGKKPNRIYGQAMAIINGSLYVFGGTTGYIYSTDLHKLDLNTREWIQLKPNNMSCDMPEERYRHEIAHDGQRIYILGGGTSWTAYSLDKIHAYNLETNTWEGNCHETS